ncbi:MAG TPA: IclR family transcriptional regulator [Mycobacteriales bacterium]|nr:IclR family transcriptional regulator [Mycobacteriales bacterium]
MEQIQVVERVAAVLAALAAGDETGRRMTDIATETGLQSSTAHRILNTLERIGYVERDEASSRYYLGYRLFSLGMSATRRFGLTELAEESMSRLAELTGDTVFLSVRTGLSAMCVDRVVGSYPIKTLTLSVGDLRPLGVGAGSLALLAWLPDDEVARVVEANADEAAKRGDFSREILLELVATSRDAGYTFNASRILPGMCAVGVPVLGRKSRPVAALSVAAVEARMQADRRTQIASWLRVEAAALEQRLGGPQDGLTEAAVRHLLDRQG